MLKGKKIILGVTGSIAAYKAALLTRLLVKEEAEVRVIMTDSASSFISPLTLSTLSTHPVLMDFQKSERSGEWNNHVELGLWADVMIIAPASANTLSKMATGLCDNLLMAVYLSARCPVMVAPAIDLDMFAHPSTARNLQTLLGFGNHIIEPAEGELASGLVGKGRMAEPEEIVQRLAAFFSKAQTDEAFEGKNVLITAGPTRETIDPVRFISNHSTGKMGYALAEEMANRGAYVTLVSGPTCLSISHPRIVVQHVVTAEQMYEVTATHFAASDIIIHSAAVADYTPKFKSDIKIKKQDSEMFIELEKTKDIAAEMGKLKQPHQLHIGFALETNNEVEHARAKLKKKNLDLIVLNSLQEVGAGFGHDTNKIVLIDHENMVTYSLKSKKQVAVDIVNAISKKLLND